MPVYMTKSLRECTIGHGKHNMEHQQQAPAQQKQQQQHGKTSLLWNITENIILLKGQR